MLSSVASIDEGLMHAAFGTGQCFLYIADELFMVASSPRLHHLTLHVQNKHWAELDIEHILSIVLCEVILVSANCEEASRRIDLTESLEGWLEELAGGAPCERKHHNNISVTVTKFAERLLAIDIGHGAQGLSVRV